MAKLSLTGWIFVALVAGLAFGAIFPTASAPLGTLGDIFLRLIASIIAPLMFGTLVAGVANGGTLKAMGRIGGKAMLLFQAMVILALVIGVLVALVIQPGAGVNLTADATGLAPAPVGWTEIIESIFPTSIFDAMARGDVLQIVIFSVLFGVACAAIGERARPVVRFCESLAEIMYRYTHYVMYAAPFGVFGTVAAAVGSRGLSILLSLGTLVVAVYIALFIFVLLVLVPLALWSGVPLGRFSKLMREPFMLAFSTTSSNVALPQALQSMEQLGVPRHIAALVLPSSMSFNTSGSALFLSLAAVFVAQAAGVALSASTLVLMVLTLLLTTKGIGAVPSGSLVILSGTLASFGLPLEGVAIIFGVDRLMDMARTSVNMLGHGLSTAVVARWEGVKLQAQPEIEA